MNTIRKNFNVSQITERVIKQVINNPSKEGVFSFKEDLFREIENECNPMNWDNTHNTYRYRMTFIFSFSSYLLMILFFSVSFVPSLSWKHITTITFSIFMGFTVWDYLAGFHFKYRFGKDAICVIRCDNRPEIIYKLVKLISWFGIVICLLLAITFGPIVFVGAGGFALMAFQGVNARSIKVINEIPYNSILYIQYIKQDDEIEVLFKDVLVGIEDNGYLEFEEDFEVESFYLKDIDANLFVDFLNEKVGYTIDYIEVVKRKHKINLFEKARALGIKLEEMSIPPSNFQVKSHPK